MLSQMLKARLSAFWQDTRGNISVEFVLAMPILFWTFMAIYVFFDGYRQSAMNLKAAYTISDLVSRETDPINDDYIDSMHAMFKLLTRATSPTAMRISVVRWDEDADRYFVDWSADRGFGSELNNATVSAVESKLPTMPDAERVILVETTNTFVPLYGGVGMDNIDLDNFVFTRPRFAPQVVWES
ncbi:MAG: TadE/TadG family type IV pilus assembly protein [Sedimentitalea sp.]